jgi:hypothetical protein
VPFPGIYIVRSAQWVKNIILKLKFLCGGPNTELDHFRRLCFEFSDYITLDDGEVPVEELINAIENPTYSSFKNISS